jgi:hypothetical protein
MSAVLTLIPNTISLETVQILTRLLHEAQTGELVGFAYVAIHRGYEFEADATGSARQMPEMTVGMLKALEGKLLHLK